MLQQARPGSPRFRWRCGGSSYSIARMKKAKSDSRGSSPKSKNAPKTVDEYLDTIPEPARSTLNPLRATIRAAAPPESIEVISYGIPAFRHQEILIWYAGFSNHC